MIFRETQKDPLLLDIRDFNSLWNSKFDKTHPTKIIIHGFGGGRNLAPSTDLRDGKINSLLLFCILELYAQIRECVCITTVFYLLSYHNIKKII